MKLKTLLASLVLAIFSVFVLASCENENKTDGYNVIFEVNGGSQIESIVSTDGKVTEPTTPTKDGYAFGGWFKDEALTDDFDFANDTISGDTTLYASWRYYTVAELIEMASFYEETSKERFYVEATIDSIDNPTYGEMTISDDTGKISVYGTYGADGEDRYSELEEKPVAGDLVLLYANVHTFNGEPEINSGWIISFEKQEPTFDLADYEELSISEARAKEVDSKVLVSGVVAKLTYNTNLNPIGFILVDDTASIYVYDSQIAPQVEEGNQVQIAGTRDNWILADEQSSADKFGYDGCIQIASCYLVENDEGNHEFAKDWIETSTVKKMLDTDVSEENITTTIYKVNALVKEKPGTGFTNFYFYDIDETTGSYTYSQASGNDFTWLREFDGKICTVYLMVLNYKSETSGLIPRLLPIAVYDEGYEFDLNETTQTVLDYYVADNFKVDTYYANPNLSLPSVVNNATLGFEGVNVSYTASDGAITFVPGEDDNVFMNIDASASKDVTVTVTITYNDQALTEEYVIHIGSLEDFDYISVTEAINSPLYDANPEQETEIVVRGIVGPSLVNRSGFYLMDDEALIAVITDDATLATVNLGDEVILSGHREQFRKDTTKVHGQTCIVDAEVLVNLYGDNEIPTSYFITDKDLAYLYDLDPNEDHSTEVYIVTATINLIEEKYYTSISLIDGDIEYNLYMANSNQYSFLLPYVNQEVTLAIAPCNWNDKNFYRGCVLYIQLADGTRIYNTLNFD